MIIIPLWFYEFGSLMYFLSSAVAFLVSYFSFRLYRYTNSRQHLFLCTAFAFITAGLVVLTIGNAISYFNFDECKPNCIIDPTDVTYLWIRFGNYGYYLTALIGYSLLALSYLKFNFKNKVANKNKAINSNKSKTSNKKFLLSFFVLPLSLFMLLLPPAFDVTILQPQQLIFVLFPFINPYFQTFHILSSILLAYIVFQVLPAYLKTKSKLSLIVLLSFLSILFYHVLMFGVAIYPIFFALAHFSLIAGFGLLLLMLVKVGVDERTKIKDASHR
jgi:hypothetical protein